MSDFSPCNVVLYRVVINYLEAVVVIFEGCERESCVHSRLFQECYIEIAFLLLEHVVEAAVLVIRDVFKDELGLTVSSVDN